MAGERVGQSLQRGVRVASERGHDRDQDHALRQADDQSREREAHHAAHVHPAGAEVPNQAAHGQGEEGGGSTLQEQAQAAHTDTWEQRAPHITTRRFTAVTGTGPPIGKLGFHLQAFVSLIVC